MTVIIFFLLILALFIVSVIYNAVQKKRAFEMTYDKLLAKCKKLVDEGKYDQLQKTLRLHPRLLLLHFNELQTALIEYSREVEESRANKEFKGD